MSFDFCCFICNLKLKSIFIRCTECKQIQNCQNFYICLDCFSQGLENHTHKSNHTYNVINLKQIQTFSNWNVSDELGLFEDSQLLNAQNWGEVRKKYLNQRLELECKDHFEDWLCILNKKQNENDTSGNINDIELFMADNSYIMRDNDIYPPRPTVHSQTYRRMSGYRAARGDFETEFNNNYELKHISEIDFNDIQVQKQFEESDEGEDEECDTSDTDASKTENFEESLKISIIKSYRDLICERYKRKKFIRNFGLLNELALNSMNNQYLLNKIQNNQLQTVLPIKFYRLFKNVNELMEYIELLNYGLKLKKRLHELKEYRQNGLRLLRHVEVYKRLKTKRDNYVKSSHLSSILTTVIRFDGADASERLNADNCKEWLKRFIIQEQGGILKPNINSQNEQHMQSDQYTQQQTPSQPQVLPRKHCPLKIENYPDWDKLNDEEKEFCRVSRIQPLVYLRVKQILIQECNKVGYVTYSRARKIACIDVNKTRKIHNLMLNLKFIKATEDVT